jgi:four helix bundle protein
MAPVSPEREPTLRLQQRAFDFAASVLLQCPNDVSHLGARELWRQLVKAAPSASHNLVEADEASSTPDFIAKMKIALREARESRNCLKFLSHCRLTAEWQKLIPLEDEARQLSLIFASILIKVKLRYKKELEEKEAKKRRRAGGKNARRSVRTEL